jgi:predicted dehydrogenase
MKSRRTFLKTTVGVLGAAATAPLTARTRIQGANDRVRLAVIGCGTRAGRVFDSFARQRDVEWAAGCEVNPAKLQAFMTPARQTFTLEMATDYRRLLERRDIDAVLVATPDFSHAQIAIDAMHAGKDVYVEKPIANTVPRINAMLEAYRQTNRVVQVGTQQRSWDHFAEAKALLDSGVLGTIRHVAIVQPGSYASPRQEPQPVPAGLDWNLWQLRTLPHGAPERPFSPNRLAFRAWYEYGSGLVGDWGAHHVDVAHWFMNADGTAPLKTAAVGLFINTPTADPEQVPDTFSISWEYDRFVMTFANGEVPRPQDDIEGWGTFFIGNNGSLQVNRMGYALRPPVPRTIRKQPPQPPPTAGNLPLPVASAPPAASGGGPGSTPPVVGKVYVNPRGGVEEDYPLDVHVRNFLDCVKSRKKPNADLEIGYHSALPCLLALESMRRTTVLGWDAAARAPKAL